MDCPRCNGTGKTKTFIWVKDCTACFGTGVDLRKADLKALVLDIQRELDEQDRRGAADAKT